MSRAKDLAEEVKKGWDTIGRGIVDAGERRTAALLEAQGYVEYSNVEAQKAFRKKHPWSSELVQPDGKIRFEVPNPQYKEFLEHKHYGAPYQSSTDSSTTTVDAQPTTKQPSPQRTPKSFAEELASGKNLQSPEDVQFYQNNAAQIEKELRSMAEDVNAFEDNDIVPDEPKTSQKPAETEVTTKTAEPEKSTAKTEPAPETVEAKKAPVAPEPSTSPKPTPSPSPTPTTSAAPSPTPAKPTAAPASKAAKAPFSKGALVKGGIVGAVAAGLYFLLKPSSSNRQPNGILTNNSVNDIHDVELQNNFTVSKFATGNASIRRYNGSGSIYSPQRKSNHKSRSMGGY